MRKNQITYRSIAFTLAFMMFFSSIGFSVDMHYCQGEIETISLFGEAESCTKMQEKESHACCNTAKIEHKEGTQLDKGECCHNEGFIISVDNSSSAAQLSQEMVKTFSFGEFFLLTYFSFWVDETSVQTEVVYMPPVLSKDISVLVQSLLI